MFGTICAPTNSLLASGTPTTRLSKRAPTLGAGLPTIRVESAPSARGTGQRSMSRAAGITAADGPSMMLMLPLLTHLLSRSVQQRELENTDLASYLGEQGWRAI